ncbi:MAG: DUF2845 domain-containing protein, partial [Gammaproteobacteria bacterium]|nr:DUF2845 domain-containing protein [Gammaproteobacteria bacterium]
LVSEGDSKAEVLIKCGAPDWTTRWSEDLVEGPGALSSYYPISEKERWLYNLGPQRFMRILLFEDGKLTKVGAGERGFSVDGDPGGCKLDNCDPGTTDFVVQMKCGAPLFIDTRYKEALRAFRDNGPVRLIRTRVEEWTYNLGPTQFLRILVFENGELVERRSGDRGFAEQTR